MHTPAEDADFSPGITEPGYDPAAQTAGASSDENQFTRAHRSFLLVTLIPFFVSYLMTLHDWEM